MQTIDPADLRRRLGALAANLAYGWRHEMRTPFVLLDEATFDRVHHSPRAMLAKVGDETLRAAGSSPQFQEALDRAERALRSETSTGGGWWSPPADAEGTDMLVAYFSTEFGVDESLPIYSGGLGVLAGDHLKASSELGLPLVGVGLLYKHGYFRQAIDDFGAQQERYPINDPADMPLSLRTDASGLPLTVEVELAGEPVRAKVWSARVGRVRLYLLDTDVEGNSAWGKRVTDSLYGGDREQRIRQEILLGVGGVRALRALGHSPTVWHMNEGHAAFMQFERLRELRSSGVSFEDAVQRMRSSTVFTTHTPVPAGNEVFDPELVRRYLGDFSERAGIPFDEMEKFGSSESWGFGMTPFALRTSAQANGVSRLHGEVSREMWGRVIDANQGSPAAPIGHVTNGTHARTFLSHELSELLGRAGAKLGASLDEQGWEKVRDIDDRELWDVRRNRKERLLETGVRRFLAQPGARPEDWRFRPDVLTIGFARRFATYKRAGLLFSDPERLARLVGDEDRPVQILLAGKAHPADTGGKDLIQQVVGYSRDSRAHGRIAFLEDYEIVLARRLVQGVDVWLNTPRRPMEASGTSGMKAAQNGGLNVSILDGWWAEGYTPEVGFAIGGEWVDSNDAVQDQADADALFEVLEQQVIPTYYDRDADGLPRRWIHMMKESIATLGPQFDASRMVAEYASSYYLPAHRGVGRPELAASGTVTSDD
ncbi:MAG: alpha-glucan phosphorylase [Thermoleophilia bacterium]|nr:alpha-glucan phosphorylase [Thermoleophilia bacterium]